VRFIRKYKLPRDEGRGVNFINVRFNYCAGISLRVDYSQNNDRWSEKPRESGGVDVYNKV
jgi:hypothetical protein